MKLVEKIKRRREDAISNGTIHDLVYWNGYLDCATKVYREPEITIKELLDHLNTIGSETTTTDELQRLYDEEYIHINFDGKRVTIPFDAVSFNALTDLLNTIVKENYCK